MNVRAVDFKSPISGFMLRYRPWAARLLISATRTVATSVQYTQHVLEEVESIWKDIEVEKSL